MLFFLKPIRPYSLRKRATEFATELSCKIIKKTFSYYVFEVQTKCYITKCKAIGIKSVRLSKVFNLFHCYHEADCITNRTFFMKWFRILRLCIHWLIERNTKLNQTDRENRTICLNAGSCLVMWTFVKRFYIYFFISECDGLEWKAQMKKTKHEKVKGIPVIVWIICLINSIPCP